MHKICGHRVNVHDDNGVFIAQFEDMQLSRKGRTEREALDRLREAYMEEFEIMF